MFSEFSLSSILWDPNRKTMYSIFLDIFHKNGAYWAYGHILRGSESILASVEILIPKNKSFSPFLVYK